MANKRDFRKYVGEVVNGICQDMMMAYYNIPGADVDAIDEAIIDVLKAGEIALAQSNVQFDKSAKAFANKKEYNNEKAKYFRMVYTKIHKEFTEALGVALKKFNAAIPQEIKDINKQVD